MHRAQIRVDEQHDQAGDLVYVLAIATHCRQTVDRVAELVDADVKWPVAANSTLGADEWRA